MVSKTDKLESDALKLVQSGARLYYALADSEGQLSDGVKKKVTEKAPLPDFKMEYEPWYSEAHAVVKQLTPDRLEDFVRCYRDSKRKDITYATYTVSDALIDLRTTFGEQTKTTPASALPKLLNQVQILRGAVGRIKSALFDMREVVQADIYDSELDAARGLNKAGFVRAAGAMAGVVLEAHLKHVCELHGFKGAKPKPTMSTFYDLLKEHGIIDVPKWRYIQSLADVRNLCDHKKEREPNKDEVFEMIDGVGKTLKTVF